MDSLAGTSFARSVRTTEGVKANSEVAHDTLRLLLWGEVVAECPTTARLLVMLIAKPTSAPLKGTVFDLAAYQQGNFY